MTPTNEWIDAKWHEACTTHGERTQDFVRWFARECIKGGKSATKDDAARRIESLESALKIIYTWAGVKGCLVPENVRELIKSRMPFGVKHEQ